MSALFVSASDPVCILRSNILNEGELIPLSCVVVYRGTWIPSIQWNQVKLGESINISEDSYSNLVTAESITSRLNIRAGASQHNTQYSSSTFFTTESDIRNDTATAVNAPGYNFTWISPTIFIYCKPL